MAGEAKDCGLDPTGKVKPYWECGSNQTRVKLARFTSVAPFASANGIGRVRSEMVTPTVR